MGVRKIWLWILPVKVLYFILNKKLAPDVIMYDSFSKETFTGHIIENENLLVLGEVKKL